MSKRSLPWLQFYPADWESDSISGCSLAAQGLWLRMMFVMHTSRRYGYLEVEGKSIPDEMMFRRCGCLSVEEYRGLLSELFAAGVPSKTENGVIYSRRMVRDQRERDSAADRQRRHRHGSVTPMSQGEVRSQRSEVRDQKSEKEKPTPTPEPPAPSVCAAPALNTLEQETKAAAFDVFWEQWPRREAKAAARRAWSKIPIAEYPALMAGLEMWRKSEQWTRGIVPHPATWLNGRRWEDEVEILAPSSGAKGGSRAEQRTRNNLRAAGFVQ